MIGSFYISVLTGLNTVVQLQAPEAARGRVLGLYMMALGTIYPIGLIIEGGIAGVVGIRDVTVASGALLIAVMAVLMVTRPGLFAALDDDQIAVSEPEGPLVTPSLVTPSLVMTDDSDVMT